MLPVESPIAPMRWPSESTHSLEEVYREVSGRDLFRWNTAPHEQWSIVEDWTPSSVYREVRVRAEEEEEVGCMG